MLKIYKKISSALTALVTNFLISSNSYALNVDTLFDEPSNLMKSIFINLVDRVLMWAGFIAIIVTILHWLWASTNGEHVKVGKHIGIIIASLFFISFGLFLKTRGVTLFD